MTRQTGIIAVLVAVLLGAMFFFFVWQPKSDEIEEIEGQIEAAELQQSQLRQELAELQGVRQNAPDIESDVVAAESIVPRDVGQAAAIRQLQLAADESGVELPNVTFGAPTQIQDATPGLASLQVTVQIDGGYYQIVDFYRRVEDPAITPRGITWQTLTLTPTDYPTLTVTASGAMYALLPTPPEPPQEETPAETPEGEEAPAEEGAA